jgi:hypothetical protein
VGSSRYAPGGNQTGVNKLQNSNHKFQTNFKLQCPNDQTELGSIELSSMSQISFFWDFRFLHWDLFVICILLFGAS